MIALPGADSDNADEISLAMAEAVFVGQLDVDVAVAVELFISDRCFGSRFLPRRLSSPGVKVMLSLDVVADADKALQLTFQEPMRAVMEATHLPEAETEPMTFPQP